MALPDYLRAGDFKLILEQFDDIIAQIEVLEGGDTSAVLASIASLQTDISDLRNNIDARLDALEASTVEADLAALTARVVSLETP